MRSPEDVTGPINLGNPTECTMLELAQLIIDLTGSRSVICFRPLPVDDPRQRQPDITKAKEILNWEPHTPLREGLTKTIAYFDELLSSNSRLKKWAAPEKGGEHGADLIGYLNAG
jgi:UDP-glucuronate decarboxylase